MGVMLSLDRHGPAKGRRQGLHARNPDGQARVQVLAAMRRYDRPVSARLLTRLTRTLGRRAPAGASRAGRYWKDCGEPGGRAWSLYPGLSVACLLGECRDEAGRPTCEVGSCEHDCHRSGTASATGGGADKDKLPAA